MGWLDRLPNSAGRLGQSNMGYSFTKSFGNSSHDNTHGVGSQRAPSWKVTSSAATSRMACFWNQSAMMSFRYWCWVLSICGGLLIGCAHETSLQPARRVGNKANPQHPERSWDDIAKTALDRLEMPYILGGEDVEVLFIETAQKFAQDDAQSFMD